MRLLLDTHTLLWFSLRDPQISHAAVSLILDEANEKWVSPSSYWEIAIKISVKKYFLSKPYEDFMREAIDDNGFGYLHIVPKHTAKLTTLPFTTKTLLTGYWWLRQSWTVSQSLAMILLWTHMESDGVGRCERNRDPLGLVAIRPDKAPSPQYTSPRPSACGSECFARRRCERVCRWN